MIKITLRLFIFLFLTTSAVANNANLIKGVKLSDYMNFNSTQTQKNRFYYGVDKDNNFFDVYQPINIDRNKPAIAIIHGGCWDSKYEGLAQSGEAIDYFISKGYTVFNIEYTKANEGGGFPGTYNDISNALLKISTIMNTNDSPNSEIILIGHSAGGHLAVWAASGDTDSKRNIYLDKIKIKKVIGLGAIVDLSISDKACPNITDFGGIDKIAGNDLTITSPILMKNNTDILLINGELDEIAPPSYAIDYFNKRNNIPANFKIISEATHYDLMSSKSGVFDTILDFIEK